MSNIRSCSKAFLASAFGLLADDFAHGRNTVALPPGVRTLDWHTRVADVLPGEWGLMDDWASARATFLDVLSHRSGMLRCVFSMCVRF